MGNIDNDGFEDLMTHLYRQIKQMIWEEELKPGAKIKQEHIAQQLKVSRSPLMKVLQRLTSENLVEYIPRRGFYVKRLTLNEMLEIYAIREVVEGVATRRVAEIATDEEIDELKQYFAPFDCVWNDDTKKLYQENDRKFHNRLIEIAGNKLLIQINEMFNIYKFSYQKGLIRQPTITLEEHRNILKFIEEKDPQNAQLMAMLHLENSYKYISSLLKEGGSLKRKFKI